MRKVALALATALTVGCWAQVFNVASLVPVELPSDVGSKVVAISGQGDCTCVARRQTRGVSRKFVHAWPSPNGVVA